MTKTASRHSGGRFDHILLVRLPILEGASGEDYTVETDGTSADGNGFPIFLIHFLQCIIQRQSAFPEITVQQSQRLPVFLLQEVIDVLPLVGNQLPDRGIRVFRRAALRQPLARVDESDVPSVFSFKIGEPQKEAPVAAVLPMAQSQLVEDARAVGGGKNSFVARCCPHSEAFISIALGLFEQDFLPVCDRPAPPYPHSPCRTTMYLHFPLRKPCSSLRPPLYLSNCALGWTDCSRPARIIRLRQM